MIVPTIRVIDRHIHILLLLVIAKTMILNCCMPKQTPYVQYRDWCVKKTIMNKMKRMETHRHTNTHKNWMLASNTHHPYTSMDTSMECDLKLFYNGIVNVKFNDASVAIELGVKLPIKTWTRTYHIYLRTSESQYALFSIAISKNNTLFLKHESLFLKHESTRNLRLLKLRMVGE